MDMRNIGWYWCRVETHDDWMPMHWNGTTWLHRGNRIYSDPNIVDESGIKEPSDTSDIEPRDGISDMMKHADRRRAAIAAAMKLYDKMMSRS